MVILIKVVEELLVPLIDRVAAEEGVKIVNVVVAPAACVNVWDVNKTVVFEAFEAVSRLVTLVEILDTVLCNDVAVVCRLVIWELINDS